MSFGGGSKGKSSADLLPKGTHYYHGNPQNADPGMWKNTLITQARIDAKQPPAESLITKKMGARR